MKTQLTRIAAPLVLAGVLTGCTTVHSERQTQEMRRHSEMIGMRAELDRLGARVQGLATAQEELFRRMDTLQTATDRAQQEQTHRITEISREVRATTAAQEQLKKEIVDGLTQRIDNIMRTQRPPAPRPQRGYEHVVEPGQTISEIASAYGVTVQAIANANGLKNPDQIRAGQKLFIPE